MKRLFARRRSFKGATFVPLEQPTTIDVPQYGSDDEPAMEVSWTVASEQILSTIDGDVRTKTESNNNSNSNSTKKSTPTKQPLMPLAPKRNSPSVRKAMSSMIRVRSQGKLNTIETASTTSEATVPSMDDERFRPVHITVAPRKSLSRDSAKSSPLQKTATPKSSVTTPTKTITPTVTPTSTNPATAVPLETKKAIIITATNTSNERQPPSPTQEHPAAEARPTLRLEKSNNTNASPKPQASTPSKQQKEQHFKEQKQQLQKQQKQRKKKNHSAGRDPPKNNSPPPLGSPFPKTTITAIQATSPKTPSQSPSRGLVKTPSSAFQEPTKQVSTTVIFSSPNYDEEEEKENKIKNDETGVASATVATTDGTTAAATAVMDDATTNLPVVTDTQVKEDQGIDDAEVKAPGHHHLQHHYDDDASSLVDDPFVDSAFDYFYGESTIGGSTIGESTYAGSTIGESTYGGSTIGESTIGESTYARSIIGESTIDESTLGESTVGDGSYYFRSNVRHGPRSRQQHNGTVTPSVDGESTLYSTLGDDSMMSAGGDTTTILEESFMSDGTDDNTTQATYRCAGPSVSGRRRSKHKDNILPEWKDVVVGLSHLMEDVTMCGSQAIEGAQDTVCQPMNANGVGGSMNETKEERRRRQAWERMRRARKSAAAAASTSGATSGSPSRGRSQTVRR